LRLKLPGNVKIQAFADDVILTKTGNNELEVQRALQNSCKALIAWGKRRGFQFSGPKTELIVFSRKHQKWRDIYIKINETEIKPSAEVRYLGVLLDSRLNWRKHIELKEKKTRKIVMELRRFARLTWGPIQRVLTTLFSSIAESVMLYAAPIWVQATKYKWCVAKLRSIQRLILLTAIRSFKSASSKTALILNNCLPMEARAQSLAAKAMLHKKRAPAQPVQSILKEINATASMMEQPCKSFLATLPPYKTETLEVHLRKLTNYPGLFPESENNYFIFTDGSKTPQGTGFAAVLTNRSRDVIIHKESLHISCTIFEAEALAIRTALEKLIPNLPRDAVISIFSDSKSVLAALNTYNQTTPTVAKIQELTINLADKYSIRFLWVPGHLGVPGNEMADTHARQAASSSNTDSAPHLTWQNIKTALLKYHQDKWKAEWENETEASQITKQFFPTVESANLLRRIKLPHQVVQILTGHSCLKTFLNRIGAAETSLCSCGEVETVEHFLFECRKFSSQRIYLKNFCRTKLNCWPPPLHLLVSSRVAFRNFRNYIMSTNHLNFNRL
jgi:ribonuclease HI